jgi:hypothetical protein
MSGSVNSIFGPGHDRDERDVTPAQITDDNVSGAVEGPLPHETVAQEDQDETPAAKEPEQEVPADFDDIPWEDDERLELRRWFEAQLEAAIPEKTKDWIRAFLADPDSQSADVLRKYKETLEKKMAAAGGEQHEIY